MKIKENEMGGAPEGFSTLDNTPGMGDVTFPTSTKVGSGDVFGGVMGFSSWKKKKRRNKKKRNFI